MSSIQTKADHRDIDSLGQKLHAKIDNEKVQIMIGEFRQEVLNNFQQAKKESLSTHKKRDEDSKHLRKDFETTHQNTNKEVNSITEKL